MPKGQTFSEPLKYAGKSVREHLEDLLEEAIRKYLEMKDTPVVMPAYNAVRSEWLGYTEAEKLLAMQRGQVRMAAHALVVWRNCYYKDRLHTIKEAEKEFVRRVKDRNGSKI